MKRSASPFFGLIALIFLLIVRPGCTPDSNNQVTVRDYYPPVGENSSESTNQKTRPTVGSTSPSSIILGSFNIQSFGPTKASKPHVLETLVDVVHRFDILAIQELRNRDQTVIRQFVDAINSDGSQYSYIVGPRQGYTYSKEQYILLFDTAKFRMTSDPYVAPNPGNRLHRAPLVTSFECLQAPPGAGFTFTLLNVHIDPDVVEQEFAAIENIMPDIIRNHPSEDDFIVLGDFNATDKKIQKFDWLENQLPLIRANWPTKVRSKRSIDNIVIDGFNTREFRNQSGVLDFGQHYGFDELQSLEVSDHFPVWAVFSTQEVENRVVIRESLPSNLR